MIEQGVRTFLVREVQRAEELFAEMLTDTEHDPKSERAFLAAEAWWKGVWEGVTFVTGANQVDQVANRLGVGGHSAAEIKRRLQHTEVLVARCKRLYWDPVQPQAIQP